MARSSFRIEIENTNYQDIWKEIVKQPQKSGTVFFLSGSNGIGKTYMLRNLQKEGIYHRVKYISIGELQWQMEIAAENGIHSVQALMQGLCDYDLLLLDDMQFVAGKEFLQGFVISMIRQAFSHTQIVMAGDTVVKSFVRKIEGIAPVRCLELLRNKQS